jgi:hypothetical protein
MVAILMPPESHPGPGQLDRRVAEAVKNLADFPDFSVAKDSGQDDIACVAKLFYLRFFQANTHCWPRHECGCDAVYPGLRPGSAGGRGFFGCFGFFFSRLLRC